MTLRYAPLPPRLSPGRRSATHLCVLGRSCAEHTTLPVSLTCLPFVAGPSLDALLTAASIYLLVAWRPAWRAQLGVYGAGWLSFHRRHRRLTRSSLPRRVRSRPSVPSHPGVPSSPVQIASIRPLAASRRLCPAADVRRPSYASLMPHVRVRSGARRSMCRGRRPPSWVPSNWRCD